MFSHISYMDPVYEKYIDSRSKTELSEFIKYFHMKDIRKNYEVKIFVNAIILKTEM